MICHMQHMGSCRPGRHVSISKRMTLSNASCIMDDTYVGGGRDGLRLMHHDARRVETTVVAGPCRVHRRQGLDSGPMGLRLFVALAESKSRSQPQSELHCPHATYVNVQRFKFRTTASISTVKRPTTASVHTQELDGLSCASLFGVPSAVIDDNRREENEMKSNAE